MNTPSEQDIWEQLDDPNRRSAGFRLLIQRYQQPLYRHIRRLVWDHHDTDDLLQNCFMKAYQGLDAFRKTSSLGTWLYRIATNEALGFLRARRRRRAHGDEDPGLAQQLQADPYFDGDEAQLALHLAMDRLPDKQRLVFALRYFEDMPYAEMEALLDTSAGSLKASYHHAQRKIREHLRQAIIP